MKRPLRASVVLTVASAAACARPLTTMNPPFVATHNPPRLQPPPPVCPATTPLGGEACATPGQRCAYESCGVPEGATANCSDGAWRVDRVSCNPPPPPLR